MPDQARITVIIPAYRVAAFLPEAIESVLAQTRVPEEIIVVDDGSPDDSAAVAQRYVELHAPRLRLIRKANGGVASARNAGLQAATGDWIAFLDGDDVWHPDKLHHQLEASRQHPDAAIVFTEFRVWRPDADGRYPSIGESLASAGSAACVAELGGWIYHQLLLTNWLLTSTVMAKRLVFDTIGPFREDLPVAEDWEIWLRAARRFQFCKLESTLVLYRQQPESLTRKVRSTDHASQIVEEAVAQWGKCSPSGQRVDEKSYALRRFRAHFNHGLSHYHAGSMKMARQAFHQALHYRPAFVKVWVYWLLAALRSVF